MRSFGTVVVSVAVLALPPIAQAKTWNVPSECPTIQAGIDSATYGDTVVVACGMYYEHDLVMKSGICLQSETGEADCVMIDAQQLGRVMLCSGVTGAARITGLTFAGGQASGGPEPNNCGGGMFLDWESSPTIENCMFTGNSAFGGAGMLVSSATPTLINCVFSDNSASGDGGGVYCANSSPILANCTFVTNSATDDGGGLYCANAAPTVTNCTLSDNSAGDGGAGIHSVGGASPSVANTIIAFSSQGTSVMCDLSSSVLLTCCDVYANAGGDWVGCIGSQYGLNGNFDRDPLFCGDANPGCPFTIRSDSPCAPGYNPDCGLIGAWPVGCEPPMATEQLTWSSVKALYR